MAYNLNNIILIQYFSNYLNKITISEVICIINIDVIYILIELSKYIVISFSYYKLKFNSNYHSDVKHRNNIELIAFLKSTTEYSRKNREYKDDSGKNSVKNFKY